MITKDNFKEVLIKLGFQDSGDSYTKELKELDALLKVDFKKDQLSFCLNQTVRAHRPTQAVTNKLKTSRTF